MGDFGSFFISNYQYGIFQCVSGTETYSTHMTKVHMISVLKIHTRKIAFKFFNAVLEGVVMRSKLVFTRNLIKLTVPLTCLLQNNNATAKCCSNTRCSYISWGFTYRVVYTIYYRVHVCIPNMSPSIASFAVFWVFCCFS